MLSYAKGSIEGGKGQHIRQRETSSQAKCRVKLGIVGIETGKGQR